jgi:hypothetical protein
MNLLRSFGSDASRTHEDDKSSRSILDDIASPDRPRLARRASAASASGRKTRRFAQSERLHDAGVSKSRAPAAKVHSSVRASRSRRRRTLADLNSSFVSDIDCDISESLDASAVLCAVDVDELRACDLTLSPASVVSERRHHIEHRTKGAASSMLSSQPVIMGVQDIVALTTSISERDEKIAALESQLRRASARAALLEDEKNSALDDVSAATAQIDITEERNDQLSARVNDLEGQNKRMRKVLPRNVMSTIGVYMSLLEGRNEVQRVQEENERLAGTETELTLAIEELERAKADCGALYCRNQELDRARLDDADRYVRLEQDNEALVSQMDEQNAKVEEVMSRYNTQIQWLKQKYFFSHALALKMALHVAGESESVQLSVNELWEIGQTLPVAEWDAFLAENVRADGE